MPLLPQQLSLKSEDAVTAVQQIIWKILLLPEISGGFTLTDVITQSWTAVTGLAAFLPLPPPASSTTTPSASWYDSQKHAIWYVKWNVVWYVTFDTYKSVICLTLSTSILSWWLGSLVKRYVRFVVEDTPEKFWSKSQVWVNSKSPIWQ